MGFYSPQSAEIWHFSGKLIEFRVERSFSGCTTLLQFNFPRLTAIPYIDKNHLPNLNSEYEIRYRKTRCKYTPSNLEKSKYPTKFDSKLHLRLE